MTSLLDAKAWAEEMDVRVTVCDRDAIIVYMNKAAISGFQKYGGAELIGQSLLDCHNPKSREIIKQMLKHPTVNVYIIGKGDDKRLIRQFPWMEDGEHKGSIEISFDFPADLISSDH